MQLQFVLGVAAYSNLSLDKLTTYTQTKHLKREKKRERNKEREKERKAGRKKKADFLLNFAL